MLNKEAIIIIIIIIIIMEDIIVKVSSWAQLFEGWLALNPGLNFTQVSLSCVQKHFLG